MKIGILIYRILIFFVLILFCLNILNYTSNKEEFSCKKIYLTGNNLMNKSELKLSLRNYIDKPIFNLDLEVKLLGYNKQNLYKEI